MSTAAELHYSKLLVDQKKMHLIKSIELVAGHAANAAEAKQYDLLPTLQHGLDGLVGCLDHYIWSEAEAPIIEAIRDTHARLKRQLEDLNE